MKALLGIAFLFAGCSLFAAQAQAQYAYYGQEDIVRCRQQTAAVGVPGMPPVMGGFAAGPAGVPPQGVLGYGLPCEDEIRLSTHLFEYAYNSQHRYRYFVPYEQAGVRIVQLASGRDGAMPPNFCRLYHVEFTDMNRQPRALQTNMCYVNNRWVFPNAAPGVPVIVQQQEQTMAPAMIRVPVTPMMRPEPVPRPMGPYRFAPETVGPQGPRGEFQYDSRQGLQMDPAIRPPAFTPPDYRPGVPGVYSNRIQ